MTARVKGEVVDKDKRVELPLPCIVCGVRPEPAFRSVDGPTWQPYAATMFDAGGGHYGSTVWDEVVPGCRSLRINVCDECLVERCDRVAVVHTIRQAPAVEFVPWEPVSQSPVS